jgi:hypothetical protein
MDIWLRQDTIDFLCGLGIDTKETLARPGKYILTQAGNELVVLLTDTRLELPDEVEYLLDEEATRGIQSKKQQIDLIRLYDYEVRTFDRAVVEESLVNGPLFDQKGATMHLDE